MRLITREQSQELDRLAMTKHDISGESLMRNAGQQIAEFVQSQLINIHNPNIGIIILHKSIELNVDIYDTNYYDQTPIECLNDSITKRTKPP